MADFEPDSYGPVLAELLDVDRCRELGPGGGRNMAAREGLESLSIEKALGDRPVVDPQMGVCLAGVWLLYDELDRAHTVCQCVKTGSGSYWHGIMHRREPDYANAKYWFRHTGDHPVFEPLGRAARTLAQAYDGEVAERLTAQTAWDPFLFVDLCETAQGDDGPESQLLRQVQQREWELLFDWCFRQAVGE